MLKVNKEKGLNVVSLFDGMGCGQLALERANIPINQFYSSEIDKHCNKLVETKFPNTIQLGDVLELTEDKLAELPKIDLLIGGSPCQGFSSAGRGLNFNDPRSKLFFEFVRVLKILKPTYFMLENVVMKQEWQDIISDYLGVQPVLIDSALVSAQQRKRLYWANFPITQPEDKNINLSDIVEKNIPFHYLTNEDTLNTLNNNEFKNNPFNSIEDFDVNNMRKAHIIGRRFNDNGKRDDYNKDLKLSQTLEVREVNIKQPKNSQTLEIRKPNPNKSGCLTTLPKTNVLSCLPVGRYRDCYERKLPFRYLTLNETAKLQTVDVNYFKDEQGKMIVSDSQAKKMLGNGWTVDVIAHIFSHIKQEEK